MCTKNKCGCENDPCGCKTKASDVVYQGPALPCLDVETCDPVDQIFIKIDELMCSEEFIEILLNNLANNISLYTQFVNLVNNSIECPTIQACITTTSTTTCECSLYNFQIGYTVGPQQVAYFPCEGDYNAPVVMDIYEEGVIYEACVKNSQGIAIGWKVQATIVDCCPPTTTTTSTTIAPTTTTTTTVLCECDRWDWQAIGANSSELLYTNCAGNVIKISVANVTNNSGSICVQHDSVPVWTPAPSSGTHILNENGCC